MSDVQTSTRYTLSGAQVTRVREAISRYEDNADDGGGGVHIVVEELVRDILDVIGVKYAE